MKKPARNSRFRSILFVLLGIYAAQPFSPVWNTSPVHAEEQWQAEFAALNAKTADVTSLSADELQGLIGKCDRLKPVIEALEESPRKVYAKRLEMTRKLLVFVLESKQTKKITLSPVPSSTTGRVSMERGYI